MPFPWGSAGDAVALGVAEVAVDSVTVATEDEVAVLDDEELWALRLAASFARSLRRAALAQGERDVDGPEADEDAVPDGDVLTAAMNFWWSLNADAGKTRVDGTFLNVCFGGTSSGGDGRRRPELDSASLVVLEDASLLWLILDDGMRGGGTGATGVLSAFGEGGLVAGASVESGFKGGLGNVGDGADAAVGDGAEAAVSDDALDGMDACEGPLPLFHAAALARASKLDGLGTSVPSSLAMTHPLRLLLDWGTPRSPCEEVAAMLWMTWPGDLSPFRTRRYDDGGLVLATGKWSCVMVARAKTLRDHFVTCRMGDRRQACSGCRGSEDGRPDLIRRGGDLVGW